MASQFMCMLACLSALVLATSVTLTSADNQDPACKIWSALENQTIKMDDKGHANCTTNADCTGFDCEALYEGHGLSFGMRVLPCQDPPGVELFGYAPHYNTKNFSHVFTHKSQYKIPGVMLNFSIPALSSQPELLQNLHGILEVHIQRHPSEDNLIMGLVAKGCLEKTCIMSKTIFNNSVVPVPECSNHVSHVIKANSVCSINELNSCGPNQVCIQEEEEGAIGLCECLSGFVLQDDGTCLSSSQDDLNVIDQTRVPKSAVASSDSNTAVHGVSDADADSASSGTLVAVVVSLLVVIVLIAAAAFVVFRTRLTPRLRARLTNTPYEDIVISHRSESTQNVVVA